MGHAERFRLVAAWSAEIPLDELQTALDEALRSARERYPLAELETPDTLSEFVAYLANAVSPDPDPRQAFGSVRVADLMLAWACARGMKDALLLFEDEVLDPGVRGACDQAAQFDEVKQALRTRLLVVPASQTPRILQYSGRGPLLAWIKMIARRTVIDLRRSSPNSAVAPTPALNRLADPSSVTDPELDYAKFRYAAVFNQALEEALRSLEQRDATLLLLTLDQHNSTEAVGRMYGVSGRTIQRRVAEIRADVLEGTRAAVRQKLSLTKDELESLMGLVQSQIHVTLHRVLDFPSDD